ncbi:DNA mismatch repair protein msh3 [Penicillium diatomitis]|uniref:DNA mismatch repair protein msh3 n=1 Tax=Penicillium diatomitis TaxID=2819901 RepID=A0A9X0BZL4_9EURO|nr:DNA mismatch repair protein msh3 [Penicillium diatomitis]KAJ5491413.1 DNA mismatch repair protein msh3 [Penicillium diatomitis]
MASSKLECMICPNRSFTDIPHILTHLSSKAHLSHQFNIQIRAYKDNDAAETLQNYNEWYLANGFAEMLSNRATSKTDRRSKRKSDATKLIPSVPSGTPVSNGTTEESMPIILAVDDLRAPPKLSGDLETRSDGGHPANETATAASPDHFVSKSTNSSDLLPNALPEFPKQVNHPINASTEVAHETPFAERCLDKYTSLPVTPTRAPRKDSKGNVHHSENGEEDRAQPQSVNQENDIATEDRSRLKGVYWPGMDIFDAATEAMRKVRNQKKDGSALRQMKLTSSLVEPTEQIFSHEGALLKERVITGEVDDDSALEGETPVPKPAPRSKRTILRDNDPNISLTQSRKRPKSHAVQSSLKVKKTRAIPRSGTFTCSNGPFGSTFLARDSVEDSDFNLTTGNFGTQANTAFTVYKDNKEPAARASMNEDHSADIREMRTTLTPARLMLDHKTNPFTHEHSIHSAEVKENIEPLLNVGARVVSPFWDLPAADWKTHDSNTNNHTASSFWEADSELGFEDIFMESRGRPYLRNNLLPPPALQHPKFHRQPSSDETVDSAGWAGLSRAKSPEAKMFDNGARDLSNVYLTGPAAD